MKEGNIDLKCLESIIKNIIQNIGYLKGNMVQPVFKAFLEILRLNLKLTLSQRLKNNFPI